MTGFTYLSIPYSHPNPKVRSRRMRQFWLGVSALIRRGHRVVSPMTLEPALALAPDLPYDWPFWRDYSLAMLALSDRLVVLTLEGWEESSGVQGEMEEAQRLGIPVEFLTVAELPEEAS